MNCQKCPYFRLFLLLWTLIRERASEAVRSQKKGVLRGVGDVVVGMGVGDGVDVVICPVLFGELQIRLTVGLKCVGWYLCTFLVFEAVRTKV